MMIQQNLKFLSGDTVRAACLHGKFLQVGGVETPLYLGKQPVHSLRAQGRRRASANIDRIQFLLPEPARQIIQFLAQRVHIFIHPLFPFGKGIGRKRTVQAGARAERNAHIQAVSMLIINIPQHIPLPVGNHDAQGRLFLAGKILLPHILRRFHIAHAFLQHQHGKPRRADPCQSPPGQRLTRICLQDPV